MEQLRDKRPLGRTGIAVPTIVFRLTALGNLYRELRYGEKCAIAEQWLAMVARPVVIDSTGKYGTGLALETLGRLLREFGIAAREVIIRNKLAWKRSELLGGEPTFEPGVWKGLVHDAQQAISYDASPQGWEEGCQLLGAPYGPALTSVHGPDEYLAAAPDWDHRARRLEDTVGACRASEELKSVGGAAAIGLEAKDWRVIRVISRQVRLDWVMLGCSLTVHTHPRELLAFIESLERAGIGIINSAVFSAGFLIGGAYYDYRKPDPVADANLFRW